MQNRLPDGIAAIVLAAGLSARLGHNKLLQPLAGKPVLHWVIDALLSVGFAPVTVVLGHESDAIQSACKTYGDLLAFIENRSYVGGRATSIQAGLGAVASSQSGVLIAPGDVPFISARLLETLISKFLASGLITYPLVNGRKGHPVIFPVSSFPLLRGLRGDETLHDYLMHHPEGTDVLAWDDAGCTLDVDTEQDLIQAKKYLTRLDLRSPG